MFCQTMFFRKPSFEAELEKFRNNTSNWNCDKYLQVL
jgi:hypothetical protein